MPRGLEWPLDKSNRSKVQKDKCTVVHGIDHRILVTIPSYLAATWIPPKLLRAPPASPAGQKLSRSEATAALDASELDSARRTNQNFIGLHLTHSTLCADWT